MLRISSASPHMARLTTPWRDGTTYLVMYPLEFMQRLAARAIEERLSVAHAAAQAARISWARLLKRVFDIDRQRCPNCGAGELKIIVAILEGPVIEKILIHLGPDPQPPPKGRAREARHDVAA
jgi:hypothetical protein